MTFMRMAYCDKEIISSVVRKGNEAQTLYFLMEAKRSPKQSVYSFLCVELGERGLLSAAYIDDMGLKKQDNLSFFNAFAESATAPCMLKELFEEWAPPPLS